MMRQREWKRTAKMVCVFLVGIVTGLIAQPIVRPTEVGARFLKDAIGAMRQFSIDARVAEAREKVDLEMARLEWEIAATHAFHEFARTVWVANEKFRRSTKDPQSRGQYAQSFGMGYSQYAQAIGIAYSSWMQARSQAFQRCQQELNAAWNALQSALNQNLQRAQQGIQQLTEAPKPIAFADLLEAHPLAFGEPEAEYRKVLEEAANRFVKELREITLAHRKEVARFARPDVDIDEADNALRKANKKWLEAALDALDNYRRACHAVLRKYKAKLEGD